MPKLEKMFLKTMEFNATSIQTKSKNAADFLALLEFYVLIRIMNY